MRCLVKVVDTNSGLADREIYVSDDMAADRYILFLLRQIYFEGEGGLECGDDLDTFNFPDREGLVIYAAYKGKEIFYEERPY